MYLVERVEYVCQFEESDLKDFTLLGRVYDEESHYLVEVTGGFGINETEYYDTLEESTSRLKEMFVEIQDRIDGRV